jgi:mRNA interferase MazF
VILAHGDLVTAVIPGDFGKPRPALVVQANPYAEVHASVTVCPLSSHLTGLRLFRVAIAADQVNGLETPSEVMVDKISSLKRDRIRDRIGKLSPSDLGAVGEALRLWLALG